MLHVRGRGLPDGEPVEWWIADGVLRSEPVADAETVWDGGWVIPGLVDAHCHVGLGPHGETPIEQAVAQAEIERNAGALLLRDCGSPTDPRVLDDHDDLPRIILEPGRSLVSNAGMLVSEVVLISRKSRTSLNRWIYLDVDMFQGLIETLNEAIKFPVWTDKNGELEEAVIAGPTCDSADIMYEDYKYPMPLNLSIGDRLYWFSTGGYTTSYSSVEFNGFPPLKAHYI